MGYPSTLYNKFTSIDLDTAIEDYNHFRNAKKHHINLSEKERNELLTKINSITKQLGVQKITPQKVKERGTFTADFTTKHGSSFNSQLPMVFIKENHVYYPTFFNNTLMVGIEVIIPVVNSTNYGQNIEKLSRGALCYLQLTFDKGTRNLAIAAMRDNGWSAYATEDTGIYVLKLGGANNGFMNWESVPWSDVK